MVDFRIRVVVQTAGAEKGAKRVERGLKRTTDQSNALRASLARAFGILGGIAIITRTIRTLANFEQAMSTVRAITGATEVQFKALTETAKELGTVTRFSATQAGEGMEFLARAGFEVEEVLTAIGPVLQLAQAGALDLGSAANIASNVLKGFRLEAEETTRIVDVLAAAAAASNTDVRKLGQALSFVAPIAASMGISVEEAAAAIGVLGDAGIPATRAGRGLNLILATLEKGSDGLAAAVARAGLTLEDIRPTTVGVAGALANLRKANISAGEAFDLFGRLGAPAFNVLQNGIPRIVELTEELNNAKGAAAEIARIMDDNLKGALFRVRSAFEGVILAFGAADRAGGLIRASFEKLAEGLRFLARNIQIVINVAETLVVLIGIKLVRALAKLAIAIAANPLGLLITAITLATALLVGFADQIEIGADSLTTLQDVGVAAFNALSDIARPVLEGIGQLFGEVFGDGRGGAGFTLRNFVEAAAATFDIFLGIVRGTIFAIRTFFSGLFTQALPDLAIQGINLVLIGFELLLDGITALFRAIGQLIATFATNFVLGFANLGRAASQALGSNFANAEQFAADAVTNFEAAFAQFDPAVIGRTVSNQFKKAQQDRIIPDLNNTFKDGAKNLGANVKEAFLVGFEQDTILGFVRSIFNEADEIAAARLAGKGGGDADKGGVTKAAEDLDKLKAAAAAVPPEIDKVVESITLLGEVTDGIVAVAFTNAGDALLDFAETGKFVFADFVDQLLDDILRLIVQLLVLQAIQAVTGTGAVAPVAGAIAPVAGFIGPPVKQAGGPVAPNRSFLVGERGPELFRPQGSGTIVPAAETAAMMARAGQAAAAPVVVEVAAPNVNVGITNQNDPNEFKEAIDSGELDISIVNVLQRRKSAARQSLGV